MNINILETAVRKALKGGNTSSKSMLSNGMITPAEHRSLESLSSQIAANARDVGGGTNSGVMSLIRIELRWA